jgi:hypothetical protein
MLKTICEQSGLNDIYTNHYLRATSITVLDFNKFEACEVFLIFLLIWHINSEVHYTVCDIRGEWSSDILQGISVQLFVRISCNSQFTALTSVLIDDVDQNENSFRSDTELPVVEPENIDTVCDIRGEWSSDILQGISVQLFVRISCNSQFINGGINVLIL